MLFPRLLLKKHALGLGLGIGLDFRDKVEIRETWFKCTNVLNFNVKTL